LLLHLPTTRHRLVSQAPFKGRGGVDFRIDVLKSSI
jgi:hypothetical protein